MKTKTILTLSIIVMLVFLIGCSEEELAVEETEVTKEPQLPTCTAPEVLVGEICCIDDNQNSICDSEETPEPVNDTPADTETIDNETEVDNLTETETQEPADTPETIVEMKNIKFSPEEITIKVGEIVTWKHVDRYNGRTDIKHKITIHGIGKSPLLYLGDSWNHTFTEAGEYSFVDAIWINTMSNGRITVTE